jgi:hypothetical protein
MSDHEMALRSSLSIIADDDDDDVNGINNDDDTYTDSTPLRIKVLKIVKESPDYIVRPANLSQQLGISINDASAELCGLLQVVGEGSSFYFEDTVGGGKIKSMVFQFPPDFDIRALRAQQKNDWIVTFKIWGEITIKALKVLVAFGLILSTIIVSIAGLAALIAAFVALSRGGGDSHGARNHITRQIHNLIITVRQLLWCYAMFGPVGDDQDPFFREVAYDTWLVMSLCCGNPGSIFFWWRAQHLRHRRQRYSRGWGTTTTNNSTFFEDTASDLEGVSLIRRNRWTGEEERIPVPSSNSLEEQRGLLSSLVEFLFGPTTSPGPSEADRWRLRSAVIVEKASSDNGNNSTSMTLQEFAPFADSPPSSLDDTFQIVKEGLSVVAHFNGVPSSHDDTTKQDQTKALFNFPELIAEGHMSTRYDDPQLWNCYTTISERNRWENFFYVTTESSSTTSSTASTASPNNMRRGSTIPKFLYEQYKPYTTLSRNQFTHCSSIAILNFVGVIWFAQSLQPGGILEDTLPDGFVKILKVGLIPILWFYARLFLIIPLARLIYIFIWNELCQQRNHMREILSNSLEETLTVMN